MLDDGREQVISDFRVVDLADSRFVERPDGSAPEMQLRSSERRHFLFLFDLSFATPTAILKARLAARDGLDKQKVYDLGLWVLAASLIGSKALMVIAEWDSYYRDNPSQIFTLDFFRSGGVFYGGFIGAVVASVIVMRVYKLPWWRTADACAPGIRRFT